MTQILRTGLRLPTGVFTLPTSTRGVNWALECYNEFNNFTIVWILLYTDIMTLISDLLTSKLMVSAKMSQHLNVITR